MHIKFPNFYSQKKKILNSILDLKRFYHAYASCYACSLATSEAHSSKQSLLISCFSEYDQLIWSAKTSEYWLFVRESHAKKEPRIIKAEVENLDLVRKELLGS